MLNSARKSTRICRAAAGAEPFFFSHAECWMMHRHMPGPIRRSYSSVKFDEQVPAFLSYLAAQTIQRNRIPG
jgi:hypothetical protein